MSERKISAREVAQKAPKEMILGMLFAIDYPLAAHDITRHFAQEHPEQHKQSRENLRTLRNTMEMMDVL